MIYFDNAATYVDDNQDVVDYFLKVNKTYIANSNSTHRLGYLVNKAVEEAKKDVLKILKLDNSYEVIFNSGATEGINHAIKGYAYEYKNRGNEIISFKNEHPATLNTLKTLEKNGFIVHYVNCDSSGEAVYDEIKKLINNNTIMVVVMSVNNEVGSINDLAKIKKIIEPFPKCVLFSDVTQSVGKIDMDYTLLDMFAFSAHKFGGLIGSGILVKKQKIKLVNLLDGGAQQNHLRAGTFPTSLSLSTVYALKKAISQLNQHYEYVLKLHAALIKGLNDIPEIKLNGISKFPYLQNFSLKSKKASVVLEALSSNEIYVSTKSACNDKNNEVSYVIKNMGNSNQLAENSIRVSFSYKNTLEEVATFIKVLKKILQEIK